MKNYYYGTLRLQPYFEGWYFKHVTRDTTILFIPGISYANHKKEAFIQVIIGQASYYFTYPIELVRVSKDKLRIQIGGNIFSKKGCKLCIHRPELTLEGVIRYGKLNILRYSIMGPLKPISYAICSHDIFSMDHAVYGTLLINGRTVEMNGARGYIEGDHGRSFPSSYVWTQCNQFKQAFTSITAAVATFPLKWHSLQGTFAIVLYKGHEYRFASYLSAKIRNVSKTKIALTQQNMTLIISLCKDNPIPLVAPVKGAMSRNIKEHVRTSVHYYFKVGDYVLINETCDVASFECV